MSKIGFMLLGFAGFGLAGVMPPQNNYNQQYINGPGSNQNHDH